MKKTIIILAVIAIIIITLFFLLRGGKPLSVNGDGTLVGEYSVSDIAKTNQALQCGLRVSDTSSSVTGSVVVAEGKARGDFDVTGDQLDSAFASHFILDDDTVYTWTSLANVGYKSGARNNDPQGGIVSVSDKASYSCRAWNADLTRFLPPSGISFQELE